MKSYGKLFEQVVALDTLQEAVRRASRGKRSRHAVLAFLARESQELDCLRAELISGTYAPAPFTRFRIHDPKPRMISCSVFRDRVVHQALCAVITPLLERRFVFDSYGCRKGKGSHRAITRAQHFSRRFAYFWKADIRSFFDSISHDQLEQVLLPMFRETRLRNLISLIIRANPLPGLAPGTGLPIGSLTSQWFANLYLDRFDHWLVEDMKVAAVVRYMDDWVVWSDSREALFDTWASTCDWLKAELALSLKEKACCVAPVTEGIPFLGYRVYPQVLRRNSIRLRRRRRIERKLQDAYDGGEMDEISLVERMRAMRAVPPDFRLVMGHQSSPQC
ncbi:MAG: RNA-directed DNA polymerase [Planctomycetota bacterium]|jgi:RNA-directed DNA polymerase